MRKNYFLLENVHKPVVDFGVGFRQRFKFQAFHVDITEKRFSTKQRRHRHVVSTADVEAQLNVVYDRNLALQKYINRTLFFNGSTIHKYMSNGLCTVLTITFVFCLNQVKPLVRGIRWCCSSGSPFDLANSTDASCFFFVKRVPSGYTSNCIESSQPTTHQQSRNTHHV